MTFWAQKRSARIFGKAIRPKSFRREMDKKALINSGSYSSPRMPEQIKSL